MLRLAALRFHPASLRLRTGDAGDPPGRAPTFAVMRSRLPEWPSDPRAPRRKVIARWSEPMTGQRGRVELVRAGETVPFAHMVLLEECGHTQVVGTTLARVRLRNRLARRRSCQACFDEDAVDIEWDDVFEPPHLRLVN
jgi:hypothetical protein